LSRTRTLASLFLLVAAAVLVLIARGAAPSGPLPLTLYAFSTQEECYQGSVLPAFQQRWEAESGRKLDLTAVFGPSATLANQIALGAPADIALFSDAQHVTYLRIARRIDRDQEALAVGHTPMVIVTRPGNPAGIASFAGLAQPGLNLLHANPRTSGAGAWALYAVYGEALQAGGDETTAAEQLRAIWGNVRLLGASARATLTLFELGAGDALITYEQDALLAQERGVPLEIVVPAPTLLAEHVAVLVDGELTRAERPAAEALLAFLAAAEGQALLQACGLRPGAPTASAAAFTIDALDGSGAAHHLVFDEVWAGTIEPGLESLKP
jgi:sulfate/thiosulfate transport system substrate-binding protein